jgi:heptosyltransferase I
MRCGLVIVRLGAVGDVLRILPLAGPARRRWQSGGVTWVVGTPVAPLVAEHPDVERVIALPRPGWSSLGAWARGLHALRASRPAVVFDLQGLAKSALVTAASGAPRRIGLGSGRAREGAALALTERLEPALRSRYQEALDVLGLGWEDWHAGAERLRRAWGLGASGRRGILLHPGSSGRNLYKRWPAERYAELAAELARSSGEPILVQHGAAEAELARELAAAVPGTQLVTGGGLLDMLRRIGGARLFVGGDSGPLHAAALAGTPAVAIYGPSDPVTYELPPGAPHRMVLGDVPCAPCRHRRCPSVECLEQLPAARVAAAARELLAETR